VSRTAYAEAADRPDPSKKVDERIRAGLPELDQPLKGANLYLDMSTLPLDQPDRIEAVWSDAMSMLHHITVSQNGYTRKKKAESSRVTLNNVDPKNVIPFMRLVSAA
jgi:hypothetical protein